ncbi:WxL domain-containing protein [Lacticaseibacillus saniviri]|uniref:WxL domain-containing protein n=1 Tax=Lacticaseibacillus saniviri TaxID=931533 RepID=UPI001EDDC47C|nr:WxL domain-containing protein [Lacticaseibacillus saniviri]MCG4283062.1 WxL domain-containing protein [Lacticaseibacillus saniviri]
MKKTLFLLPTLLIAPILFQANQHVMAETEVAKKGTPGAVEFAQDDTPLRFGELPNFHFGMDQQYDRSREMLYSLATNGDDIAAEDYSSSSTVQIIDNRGITSDDEPNEWVLQAIMSTQFTNEDGKELDNATIEMHTPDIGLNGGAAGSVTPPIEPVVEISEGGPVTLAEGKDAGGLTELKYGEIANNDDRVKLKLPQGTKAVMGKVYQAEITWTLLDAPLDAS